MNSPIKFLLKVLRGRIKFSYIKDGKVKKGRALPYVRQPYKADQVPCFSFDDSGGSLVLDRKYIYDPQEWVVETKETPIKIHVFTNNVDDDDKACSIIDNLLFQSLTGHYSCCMNYDEGFCNNFRDLTKCHAIKYNTRFRSFKNQCPDPEELGYESALSHYNILRESVSVEDPFHVDELDYDSPIIHSIIRVNMTYRDYKLVGGEIATDVWLNDMKM